MTTPAGPVAGTQDGPPAGPGQPAPAGTFLSGDGLRARPRVRWWTRPEPIALAALAGLFAAFSAARPGTFPTTGNIEDLAMDAAVLWILSVGITYITVLGLFDLSIGMVLVFAEFAADKTMAATAAHGTVIAALAGLAAALAAGLAWGILNGVLVSRYALSPFIVTLGTMQAALGTAELISGGQNFTDVPPGLQDAFGLDSFLGFSWLAWTALAVAVTGGLVLAFTRFGQRTYAIGSNIVAARRAGIPVDRHIATVYALVGLLAGLGGFLSLARFGTTELGAHTTDALDALTAVVLGGAALSGGQGAVLGTSIGVMIPIVLEIGLVMIGWPTYTQDVVTGAILVAAILLDRRRRAARRRAA
jgi:ribose transport system permease protein